MQTGWSCAISTVPDMQRIGKFEKMRFSAKRLAKQLREK